MALLDEFAEVTKLNEPLAPYTHLKVGGPAQALVQPRSVAELAKLIRHCRQEQIPWRILGAGCNLLVSDEGVRGVVVRLNDPAFCGVVIKGNIVRAGGGAALSALISEAARHAVAGVESLVGIPGTVGGVVRMGAGSRSGGVNQVVRQIEMLDAEGNVQVRERDDIDFSSDGGTFDDMVILAVEFELEPDDPDSILKRMRKFWIHRKAQQPLSFQASGRIFRDPRGLAADQLIEQAGLKGTRVGGAEISDRNANFIVAHSGTTARDVLRLIELTKSQVAEKTGQRLELEIIVWR